MSHHPRNQNAGEQVASILNPVRGVRDQQLRDGRKPVDHARRNFEALKEKERQLREKREESSHRIDPVPFKLKKFENTQSRVKPASPCNGRSFLKKGNGVKPQPIESSVRKEPRMKLKEPTPTDRLELAPRTNKNFIASNSKAILSKDAENRARHDVVNERKEKVLHDDFGKVPRYLQERQMNELRAKEEVESRQKDHCPAGMVMLSEGERLKTLEGLRRNVEEIQNGLRKFPLSLSSMAQRHRKTELEEQLKQQEDAILIFDKEKVYVYE